MEFEASKIKVDSVVDSVGKPVLFGALGAAAGHFAGKGKNLLLAAGVGIAGIAMGQAKSEWLVPAVVGMAVVTPQDSDMKGIDGLDSLKSFVTGGTSRAKGYAGNFLGNMGLSSVAAKVGLQGVDDEYGDYDQGYMNGLEDYALLNDGSEVSGLGGYSYGEAGMMPKSLEAQLALQVPAMPMGTPMMGIQG